MTDIIMTVVCVGIASGIISLFFDDDTEMSKYIRLVLSLCFLCSIIPGGIKLFSKIEFDSYIPQIVVDTDIAGLTENYNISLANEASKKLSDKLETLIFENTGIKPVYVDIQLSVTSQEDAIVFSFEKVSVAISKGVDVKRLCEYVSSVCGVDPEIVYE